MFCRRALRRLADARWLVAAGHYGWPVPLAIAVGMRFMPSMAYALSPLLVAGLVPVAVHAGGICPRCAPHSTPTCPTREVERARTALALTHRPLRQPVTWAVLAAHLAVTFGFGGVYGRWSSVTVIVAFAGGMWAVRRHARLRPWCPWCSGGGPGEDPAPAPDGPGGLSVDPTRPAGPVAGPSRDWTVADLQAGWAVHPAPAEPARPGVRPGRAGVPGQRAGGAR
jgi:hypothetical protein